MSLSVLLAAGGTGGHMVPAHALSEELRRRGHRVTLLTDSRGLRFPGLFEAVERHVLDSATAAGLNPVAWVRAALAVWRGRAKGRAVARAVEADAVVGFGGYPSLPGLLAGLSLRLAAVLHEQNAVLGRVNRRLQRRVSAIALSFPSTARLDPALGSKAVVTGNPVREAILAARDAPFSAPAPGQPFRLLVVGGSQGARILAERVPAAAQRLPEGERRRLAVVQQCRPEDLSAVLEAWRAAGIEADCRPYLEDMPEQLAAAHLVVARAGASTVAELAAIGRPSILIPFAAAADDHQSANAAALVAAGGAVALAEVEATPAALAGAIRGFLDSPEALEGAAAAARGVGVPDAARRLADLVEHEVRALAGVRPEGRA